MRDAASRPARLASPWVIGSVLVALTVIGLWLFRILDPGSSGGSSLLLDIGVIMGLALVKAYLVGAEFMELRRSASWLKALFGAWLLLTWLAILATTYLGMRLDSYIHFL